MVLTFLTLVGALVGCSGETGPEGTGTGVLALGCPQPGAAYARALTDDSQRPGGANALAQTGDVALVNSRAAFVIGAPGNVRTWYPYGGVPIDALAIDGCTAATQDRLGELGFLIGELDLENYDQSAMRMFRGERLEVVSDGSDGGAAVVEVHGVDDYFWLVELELVKTAFGRGATKALTEPFGLDLVVRYTLAPDEAVLQIDVVMAGETGQRGYLVGAFTIPSDRTDALYFHNDRLEFGPLSMDAGIPWFTAGSAEGSVAIALPGANMALMSVGGTKTLVDLNQAVSPLSPGFDGTATMPFLLSVGAGQTASASCELLAHHPEPVPGLDFGATPISGRVVDGQGAGVEDAVVEVLLADSDGTWRVLDRLAARADGRFSGVVAALDKAGWQLRATGAGRDVGEISSVTSLDEVQVAIGARGRLLVDTRDDGGTEVPARVEVVRSDGAKTVFHHVPGDGGHPLPPGDYDAWLSRGYEHSVETGVVTVPDDGDGTLAATLTTWLDTTGWMSIDSHLHSEPSPDSGVLPPARMASAAAGGLEVVVSTDHEAIVDLSGAVAEAGVTPWVRTQLGSEVTATIPEHTNAWPFPPEPDKGRGDPVQWQGQGMPNLVSKTRDRGAEIVQLNHARKNGECGLLCLLSWDRLSALPALDDPTRLGMPAGEDIWSWDLDAIEVQNGMSSPFLLASDPNRSGAFEDWLSFHNLGHRVTGMAVTDAHGADIPGQPRTYLAVDDDDPSTVSEDALVDAVLGGRAVMSAGAFARVSIDGAGPGEQATAVDGAVTLDLEVQALAEIDVQHLEILVNCDEVAEVVVDAPDGVLKHAGSVDLVLAQDAAVVVVGLGSGGMPRGLKDYDPSGTPRFISNPIFVDVDGDGVWTAPGPKGCVWSPVLGESSR